MILRIIKEYPFEHTRIAITIQRYIRGHFVRFILSPQTHGIAWKQPTICVNNTDFHTMDPLNEIHPIQFFSYSTRREPPTVLPLSSPGNTSNNGFYLQTIQACERSEDGSPPIPQKEYIYGFDVHSLILLHRKRCMGGSFTNPYNRMSIPQNIIRQIFTLYNLLRIVFPTHVIENDPYIPFTQPRFPRRIRSRTVNTRNIVQTSSSSSTSTFLPQLNVNGHVVTLTRYQIASMSIMNGLIMNVNYESPQMVLLLNQLQQKTQLLESIRQKPTLTRIQEIFMEMDQLGNYTESRWMIELDERSLYGFHRHLMMIWCGRGHISYDTKYRICPLSDPFELSLEQLNELGSSSDIDALRKACLVAMEYMIFSGFDEEYRKLGILHVLTALTVVSANARSELLWLYESLY